MTNTITRKVVLLMFSFLPFAGMAWGVEGHRVVGLIAERHLTAKAKKEVARVLGNESIAMVSNWADFIKSDPSYNYLYTWHFINLKPGLSESDLNAYLVKDTTTNAYTKINFLVATLKQKDLRSDRKRFYLKLLIHLVGDIHQPLHTGCLEDQGGNKINVLWFNEPRNLHQVWDEQLVLFQQLSYTEYVGAIDFVSAAQEAEWQHDPVGKWVYQSYQLVEKIYSEITQPDQRLDYKYNFNYVESLNLQLLKSGVRLAGVLNDIFR